MKFLRSLCTLIVLVCLGTVSAAQAHRLYDPGNAGLHVQVGMQTYTFFGPSQLPTGRTSAPVAGIGESLEVSWTYTHPIHGSRVIRVAMERQPGQSLGNFASRFREAVAAMLELYPPTHENTLRTSGPGSVLEVSWKHDTDGDGGAAPINVVARVELGAGESAAEGARRLKRLVEELQETFPPNVKETP